MMRSRFMVRMAFSRAMRHSSALSAARTCSASSLWRCLLSSVLLIVSQVRAAKIANARVPSIFRHIASLTTPVKRIAENAFWGPATAQAIENSRMGYSQFFAPLRNVLSAAKTSDQYG